MKKGTILIIFLFFLFFALPGYSQEAETEIPPQPRDKEIEAQPTVPPAIELGRIYFPRDFVHADKEYKKGIYRMALFSKENVSYFRVSDRKGEPLFEELAIVKPNKMKSKKFRYGISKEMLKGYEYFRISVTKPGEHIMAFFLTKQEEKTGDKKEESAEKDGE